MTHFIFVLRYTIHTVLFILFFCVNMQNIFFVYLFIVLFLFVSYTRSAIFSILLISIWREILFLFCVCVCCLPFCICTKSTFFTRKIECIVAVIKSRLFFFHPRKSVFVDCCHFSVHDAFCIAHLIQYCYFNMSYFGAWVQLPTCYCVHFICTKGFLIIYK